MRGIFFVHIFCFFVFVRGVSCSSSTDGIPCKFRTASKTNDINLLGFGTLKAIDEKTFESIANGIILFVLPNDKNDGGAEKVLGYSVGSAEDKQYRIDDLVFFDNRKVDFERVFPAYIQYLRQKYRCISVILTRADVFNRKLFFQNKFAIKQRKTVLLVKDFPGFKFLPESKLWFKSECVESVKHAEPFTLKLSYKTFISAEVVVNPAIDHVELNVDFRTYNLYADIVDGINDFLRDAILRTVKQMPTHPIILNSVRIMSDHVNFENMMLEAFRKEKNFLALDNVYLTYEFREEMSYRPHIRAKVDDKKPKSSTKFNFRPAFLADYELYAKKCGSKKLSCKTFAKELMNGMFVYANEDHPADFGFIIGYRGFNDSFVFDVLEFPVVQIDFLFLMKAFVKYLKPYEKAFSGIEIKFELGQRYLGEALVRGCGFRKAISRTMFSIITAPSKTAQKSHNITVDCIHHNSGIVCEHDSKVKGKTGERTFVFSDESIKHKISVMLYDVSRTLNLIISNKDGYIYDRQELPPSTAKLVKEALLYSIGCLPESGKPILISSGDFGIDVIVEKALSQEDDLKPSLKSLDTTYYLKFD